MHVFNRLLSALCVFIWVTSSAVAEPMAPANDTRARAMQSINQSDTAPVLQELFRLARSGDDKTLLQQLDVHASHPDWPAAARDYVLHAFARAMGDLEAGSIAPEVVHYLESATPEVLVPHPDYPHIGVPLFNIAAAATGSMARWHYDEARASGARLMAQGAAVWLDTYLHETLSGRQGMRDGQANFTPGQNRLLGELALAGSEKQAERTEVATQSALLLQDQDMLKAAILTGSGAALTTAVRQMHAILTPGEVIGLAADAVKGARPATAALIFAQSADRLAGEPAMTDVLFNALPDPELGGAAAQALARNTNPEVRVRLQQLADSGDSLPARRANLALRLWETRGARQ